MARVECGGTLVEGDGDQQGYGYGWGMGLGDNGPVITSVGGTFVGYTSGNCTGQGYVIGAILVSRITFSVSLNNMWSTDVYVVPDNVAPTFTAIQSVDHGSCVAANAQLAVSMAVLKKVTVPSMPPYPFPYHPVFQ